MTKAYGLLMAGIVFLLCDGPQNLAFAGVSPEGSYVTANQATPVGANGATVSFVGASDVPQGTLGVSVVVVLKGVGGVGTYGGTAATVKGQPSGGEDHYTFNFSIDNIPPGTYQYQATTSGSGGYKDSSTVKTLIVQ